MSEKLPQKQRNVLLHRIVKLTNGETLISKIPCGSISGEVITYKDRSVIIIRPLKIEKQFIPIEDGTIEATKLVEWNEYSTDITFEIPLNNIVNISSANQHIINIYDDTHLHNDFIQQQPELANLIYNHHKRTNTNMNTIEDEYSNEEDEFYNNPPLDDLL